MYDIDGPRVRLGFLWFVVTVAALIAGVPALAAVYGITAAVAAAQTAAAWRAKGQWPHREVAALGAGAMTLAAAASTQLVGIVVLALVAAAIVMAQQTAGRRPWVIDAGYTIQCSLFVGLAAAGLVIAARYELGSVVALVLLVASYETGDFIVGSGARNSVEGPIAGIAAIVVMSFSISALGIPPFRFPAAFGFGLVAAVLCPVGQLFASAVLPSAAAKASALRRLDSLLLLGVVWAFAIGLYR